VANAVCERTIGTVRRECLDYLIPITVNHLRSILRKWANHFNADRPHSSSLVHRPEPFTIPAELVPLIEKHFYTVSDGDPVIFQSDLDDDGQFEYLLMIVHEHGIGFSTFYYKTDDGWQQGQVGDTWNYVDDNLRARIVDGDIEMVVPRFKNLTIGGTLLRPAPNGRDEAYAQPQ
jgi:hypothetical protein